MLVVQNLVKHLVSSSSPQDFFWWVLQIVCDLGVQIVLFFGTYKFFLELPAVQVHCSFVLWFTFDKILFTWIEVYFFLAQNVLSTLHSFSLLLFTCSQQTLDMHANCFTCKRIVFSIFFFSIYEDQCMMSRLPTRSSRHCL